MPAADNAATCSVGDFCLWWDRPYNVVRPSVTTTAYKSGCFVYVQWLSQSCTNTTQNHYTPVWRAWCFTELSDINASASNMQAIDT